MKINIDVRMESNNQISYFQVSFFRTLSRDSIGFSNSFHSEIWYYLNVFADSMGKSSHTCGLSDTEIPFELLNGLLNEIHMCHLDSHMMMKMMMLHIVNIGK